MYRRGQMGESEIGLPVRMYLTGLYNGDARKARAVMEVVLCGRPVRQVARTTGLNRNSLQVAARRARRGLARLLRKGRLAAADLRLELPREQPPAPSRPRFPRPVSTPRRRRRGRA